MGKDCGSIKTDWKLGCDGLLFADEVETLVAIGAKAYAPLLVATRINTRLFTEVIIDIKCVEGYDKTMSFGLLEGGETQSEERGKSRKEKEKTEKG